MIGGAGAHWGAIGAMAAAATAAATPSDPKDAKIKQLSVELVEMQTKLGIAESRLVTCEGRRDRADITVDDQAATIVNLRATLALARPASPEALEMGARMRTMQRVEDQLRASLERAEARAAQLVAAWPKGSTIPNEPAYFREGGIPWGEGTGA